jgi:hypothetical protein
MAAGRHLLLMAVAKSLTRLPQAVTGFSRISQLRSPWQGSVPGASTGALGWHSNENNSLLPGSVV